MKVVLLEDIPGIGRTGEIKEVRKGYAKNFLLPRKLALIATPAVAKQVESRLQREKLAESVDREKLVELAQQIEGKEIRFKARMGGGERLFGSVTAADIAEELGQAIGSVIDKKKIDIERPFHQTGSYEIPVKLAADIKPKIVVVIEEEEKEAAVEQKAETEEKAEVKEKAETEKKTEKKQEKGKKQEKKKGKAKEEEGEKKRKAKAKEKEGEKEAKKD